MQVYAPYRAALCILFAELFLVCSGMVVKQISAEVSTALIVFFRNVFGLMLMLPWLLQQGFGVIRSGVIHLHLLRALVGVTAMLCLYYSWGHLPLAEAALLKQTAVDSSNHCNTLFDHVRWSLKFQCLSWAFV